MKNPKFSLGRCVATSGVIQAVSREEVMEFIERHVTGDWGEVCLEDAELNDLSVNDDGRILSVYTSENGIRVWVVTEADRSSTTVLLPDEY